MYHAEVLTIEQYLKKFLQKTKSNNGYKATIAKLLEIVFGKVFVRVFAGELIQLK